MRYIRLSIVFSFPADIFLMLTAADIQKNFSNVYALWLSIEMPVYASCFDVLSEIYFLREYNLWSGYFNDALLLKEEDVRRNLCRKKHDSISNNRWKMVFAFALDQVSYHFYSIPDG